MPEYLELTVDKFTFVEIKPIGAVLTAEDEVAAIETIKVNVALNSPVSGTVIEVNPTLEIAPEAINQDPYGAGWLAVLSALDWETDRSRLLDAAAYFEAIQREVAEELK